MNLELIGEGGAAAVPGSGVCPVTEKTWGTIPLDSFKTSRRCVMPTRCVALVGVRPRA